MSRSQLSDSERDYIVEEVKSGMTSGVFVGDDDMQVSWDLKVNIWDASEGDELNE